MKKLLFLMFSFSLAMQAMDNQTLSAAIEDEEQDKAFSRAALKMSFGELGGDELSSDDSAYDQVVSRQLRKFTLEDQNELEDQVGAEEYEKRRESVEEKLTGKQPHNDQEQEHKKCDHTECILNRCADRLNKK